MTFLGKNFHLHAQNFWWPFFSHRLWFSDFFFRFSISLLPCSVVYDPFFTRKTPVSENNFFITPFFTLFVLSHASDKHYFSKYWGTDAWAVPTSIFWGDRPPSPPRSPPVETAIDNCLLNSYLCGFGYFWNVVFASTSRVWTGSADTPHPLSFRTVTPPFGCRASNRGRCITLRYLSSWLASSSMRRFFSSTSRSSSSILCSRSLSAWRSSSTVPRDSQLKGWSILQIATTPRLTKALQKSGRVNHPSAWSKWYLNLQAYNQFSPLVKRSNFYTGESCFFVLWVSDVHTATTIADQLNRCSG